MMEHGGNVLHMRTEKTEPPKLAKEVVISSVDLFDNLDEVWIEHGGMYYRLSKTRAGKLILTK